MNTVSAKFLALSESYTHCAMKRPLYELLNGKKAEQEISFAAATNSVWPLLRSGASEMIGIVADIGRNTVQCQSD